MGDYEASDGLGSVTKLSDAAGSVAASYSYEPFGKLVSSTGTVTNPYRWLGALGVYLDTPSGLYKMGTRYYDPALGRFTQVDPVEGGSANRYDYGAQDPINNLDLDGELCVPCGIALVVGVRVAAPIVGGAAVRATYKIVGRTKAKRVTTPAIRSRQARVGAHDAHHGQPPHLQFNWWRVGKKGKPSRRAWHAKTGRRIPGKK